MKTSFNILAYNNAFDFKNWKQAREKNLEIASNPKLRADKKVETRILTVFAAFFWAIILFISFKYALPPQIVFLVSIMLFAFIVNINGKKSILRASATHENLQKTSQKIHFCEKEILIENKGKMEKYAYQEMQNLHFYFTGVSPFEITEPNWVRWEMGGREYFHFFHLDTEYKKEQLLGVLKYLYSKNIPFQERNEKEETLYLLRLPAPAEEPPKPRELPKIDAKYLKMIEEIGKNEDE
jgi:hypothetical protein